MNLWRRRVGFNHELNTNELEFFLALRSAAGKLEIERIATVRRPLAATLVKISAANVLQQDSHKPPRAGPRTELRLLNLQLMLLDLLCA